MVYLLNEIGAACSRAASWVEKNPVENNGTLCDILSSLEEIPLHGSVMLRFTLFPPQDNVIVAIGRRRHPLSDARIDCRGLG
jgi:hypothetical protein